MLWRDVGDARMLTAACVAAAEVAKPKERQSSHQSLQAWPTFIAHLPAAPVVRLGLTAGLVGFQLIVQVY